MRLEKANDNPDDHIHSGYSKRCFASQQVWIIRASDHSHLKRNYNVAFHPKNIATPLSRRFPLQQRLGPKGKISLASYGAAMNSYSKAKTPSKQIHLTRTWT